MKTLKQFYRELQAWIDDGCPEHEDFQTLHGLCDNLVRWSGSGINLSAELEGQFIESGLHELYPFNGGLFSKYRDEDDCYQNPARLQWIKEHAK